MRPRIKQGMTVAQGVNKGIRGRTSALSPSPLPKCKHDVYNPHGDAAYCSVCNPASVTAHVTVRRVRDLTIGTLKNANEMKAQAEAMLDFYAKGVRKPAWYKAYYELWHG